jgi:ATPase family protein associated with various cellular activities (AAA)
VNTVASNAQGGSHNRPVADDDLPPARLASVFANFVQQVASAASPETSPLLDKIWEHLGTDPAQLPVTLEQLDTFEQPNLQLAIDAYIKQDGHSADLYGVSMENKRFMAVGLSELVIRIGFVHRPALHEGPVDYVNYHLADDEVLSCVQFGLYLVRADDARLAALITGPSEMGDPRRQKLRLEVMATRPGDAVAFIAAIRGLMNELNVYRGHAITLSAGMHIGPGPQTLVQFQAIPQVRREDVVLPDGLLEQIERQTINFSQHADQLLKAGRSLKRGVLLFGLPGTGKTLTLMYLIGRMPERTTLLTTGSGMGLIQTVATMARQLAPSMVVLEDVDLVAQERTTPGFGARPVLFELLNEMDGLRDDQDVIFVLTTNRPDILEPALAARPGRIDLAIELPLPTADGRRRLLDVYSRGLTLDGVDIPSLVERTEGATPAYIKELLRKATVHALEAGASPVLRQADVDLALEDLAQGGRLAERILGFRPEPVGPPHQVPSAPPAPPIPGIATGFPAQIVIKREK